MATPMGPVLCFDSFDHVSSKVFTGINGTSLESPIIVELEFGIKSGMALAEKFLHPSELKIHHLWEIKNYFPQFINMPNFIYAFKQPV